MFPRPTSVPSAVGATDVSPTRKDWETKPPAIPSAVGATHLIRRQIANRSHDIRRLRQDGVLKRGVIRAKRVRRRHAAHRRIELAKKLVRDPRRNLCAVAP